MHGPDLAAQIKALRKRKNWTQPELARRLGIDLSTVWRWENGRTYPSGRNLLALTELMERKGK